MDGTGIRHIIIFVMALCTTYCHAQVRMIVVPDIAEAITRVIEADDFQRQFEFLVTMAISQAILINHQEHSFSMWMLDRCMAMPICVLHLRIGIRLV